MLITAICGATVKDLSLPLATNEAGELMGWQAIDAITRSVWLLPGAIVGGWFGAVLTNTLPIKYIRIVFAILVLLASCKMIYSGSISIF
jgi:uncharacterized membrane protein YfcA